MVKALQNSIIIKLEQNFFFVDYSSYENDITQQENDQKSFYDIKSISVFDHWLTEQEYIETPVVYYENRLANSHAMSTYDKYEARFLNFYSYLYDTTEIYSTFFNDRGSSFYVKFTTKDSYLSHILLSIREQLSLKIILPEYYSVIDGGSDLTHILRVKKGHLESLEAISKIVDQHGLYILS
jgi:hypothetical protein